MIAQEEEAVQAEVQEVILKEAIDHLTMSASEAVDQKENAYRTLIKVGKIMARNYLFLYHPRCTTLSKQVIGSKLTSYSESDSLSNAKRTL